MAEFHDFDESTASCRKCGMSSIQMYMDDPDGCAGRRSPVTDHPTQYPPHDKLEPIFREAVANLKELATEIIGNIESEYLPHLENDTFANVRIQAQRAIKDFLAGSDRDDTAGWFVDFNRDEILQRIYEQNRDAIEAKIGDMLRREIESLKNWFATKSHTKG